MDRFSSSTRNDSRIILHFDYDCFYASVFEVEDPTLKNQPLAVQQKQIIVTCNYEARRRGLYKLQLISEAKRVCPEAVIVLGEDLTRFRNASKLLYSFLLNAVWSGQAERLGFDEVFLDCTDMVNYNVELLNHNDLAHSFFCLDKDDPTIGFPYSATAASGPTYPKFTGVTAPQHRHLYQRLVLGSHLARFLRLKLEKEKYYTATVGVSTNKLLAKLVGNVNKPNSQTTLLPPYEPGLDGESSITTFMDSHDIGKIPGIGFKLSQKVRAHILGRQPAFEDGLVYGGTKEDVKVRDVRTFPGMGPAMLENIFRGPGAARGIGGRIWELLHGVDDGEVRLAKMVPSQISIEDSYMRLHTVEEVVKELSMLSRSLIKRMRADLLEENESDTLDEGSSGKWLAHPRILRLSTRPRPARNPDGSRPRSFNRISRSVPMPFFAFGLVEDIPAMAERLVHEALLPAFKKLHPERSGWDLSLINVAVTSMAETAADNTDSHGRDISRMFRQQDNVLKTWRIPDVDNAPDDLEEGNNHSDSANNAPPFLTSKDSISWDSDDEADQPTIVCDQCGVSVPRFASVAHRRYHDLPD